MGDRLAEARGQLANVRRLADAGCKDEALEALIAVRRSALSQMDPDECSLATRGYRGLMARVEAQTGTSSGGYELGRAQVVQRVLVDLGFCSDGPDPRDLETGRRVKSILRELGRLDYWNHDEGREGLASLWPQLRNEPLWAIKIIVRRHNPRGRVAKASSESLTERLWLEMVRYVGAHSLTLTDAANAARALLERCETDLAAEREKADG